jgi:ParB-like chromosome segregation protein Spo0J
LTQNEAPNTVARLNKDEQLEAYVTIETPKKHLTSVTSKVTINIPQAENVNVVDLKTDQNNPNKMSKEQHERLSASIRKWGFIVPIITNKDLLIADGEQRWTVAKSLGMTQVSVIKLPVEDVDRRLLRQVLNKLRGEHDRELDAAEFQIIIDLGKEDDLKYLLDLSDDKLDGYLKEEEPIGYQKTFEVIVECEDETIQEAVYNKLQTEGYNCRVLTL